MKRSEIPLLYNEYHVSQIGNDAWEGSFEKPFKTISTAAQKAFAGDTITVHEGIYRERVNPPRGGESDTKRIIYQAAQGELVEIKGSEIVDDWEVVNDHSWKKVLSHDFFGDFNPFDDLIYGDWFSPLEQEHHSGMVYLNGEWLIEAANLAEVLENPEKTMIWFAHVDEKHTTIWANFGTANPNESLVELNVRQSVFYPEQTGINYVTVRGFTMSQAATPWAPPTAEQIGLIGTHWSKGWIIEDNIISHSKCTGITLGKYGDEWDNIDPTTFAGRPAGEYKKESTWPSADSYNLAIDRALKKGWNKDTIGHHIVRRNHISHCEMAGIVGSLGACYSIITENVLHDIHVIRTFSGAEMAAIKFHAAIDTLISHNHIYNSDEGIWLDWMTQGTRVTGNLTHHLRADDLFVEVSHGPYVIDNNLFLSPKSNTVVRNLSQGGTYAHNIFMGDPEIFPQLDRSTPYHEEHSTSIAGVIHIEGGDDRIYNNLYISEDRGRLGLHAYDASVFPVVMDGNVYLEGISPSNKETNPVLLENYDSQKAIIVEEDGVYLELNLDVAWKEERTRQLVTSKLLGETSVSKLPFKDTDGKELVLDKDYFGKKRDVTNPYPGPFEINETGKQRFKIWPIN